MFESAHLPIIFGMQPPQSHGHHSPLSSSSGLLPPPSGRVPTVKALPIVNTPLPMCYRETMDPSRTSRAGDTSTSAIFMEATETLPVSRRVSEPLRICSAPGLLTDRRSRSHRKSIGIPVRGPRPEVVTGFIIKAMSKIHRHLSLQQGRRNKTTRYCETTHALVRKLAEGALLKSSKFFSESLLHFDCDLRIL
jgi:hypothetical protein